MSKLNIGETFDTAIEKLDAVTPKLKWIALGLVAIVFAVWVL